jgi:aspartate/methionine/tyrosine aminotransferase
VWVIPGDHFGVPGHIRLSYALDLNDLRIGFTRVVDTMKEMRRGS